MENWLFYLQKYKFLTKCLYLFLGDTANQYRETIYIYNTDEIQRDMHQPVVLYSFEMLRFHEKIIHTVQWVLVSNLAPIDINSGSWTCHAEWLINDNHFIFSTKQTHDK